MLDKTSVREGYKRNEISDLGFFKSKNICADAFTKLVSCDAFYHIFLTGKCDLPFQQWIMRNLSTKTSEIGHLGCVSGLTFVLKFRCYAAASDQKSDIMSHKSISSYSACKINIGRI